MDASHGIPHILALSILKVTSPKSCSGPLSPLLGPSPQPPKVSPEPPQTPPDLTNLPLLPAPSFKEMMSEKAPSLQAAADRVSPPTLFYMLKQMVMFFPSEQTKPAEYIQQTPWYS